MYFLSELTAALQKEMPTLWHPSASHYAKMEEGLLEISLVIAGADLVGPGPSM